MEIIINLKIHLLGADDGIGIAIILAILQENENIPNIEVMITTQRRNNNVRC